MLSYCTHDDMYSLWLPMDSLFGIAVSIIAFAAIYSYKTITFMISTYMVITLLTGCDYKH